MPYDAFEDLSKKIAQGSGDVKDSLEGIIGAAENADQAYKKLTRTQEASLKIEEKFEKALNLTSKALSVVGHSSMSAARGLKVIDTISKSAAGNLNAIGVGASSAAFGFKALSSVANSFSSDISGAEKGIAGLVQHLKKIPTKAILPSLGGGLPPKQSIAKMFGAAGKGIPPQSIANMFKVNLPSSATPLAQMMANTPSKATNSVKKVGFKVGKEMVKSFASSFSKKMGSSIDFSSDMIEEFERDSKKLSAHRKDFVELSIKVSGEKKLKDILDSMEYGTADLRRAWMRFNIQVRKDGGDTTKALEQLKAAVPQVATSIERAQLRAKKSAEELTSQMSMLNAQVEQEVRTFPDLFKKTFAQGGVEAGKFAEGLGGTATGMLAVGVAGAFLATKLSDVVDKFADAVIGLAKFKTETAALERTIIGMNKGALDKMRKQLSLTRQQAMEFFSVMKTGVNELGMSQEQIMKVAKALQETFGGDQTDRLKKYVDILKVIPTIETDLKVTSSMDDQTKAIFGLFETGNIGAVADLSAAGLFGKDQKKMPGADTAKAAAKAAAAQESIKDSLLKFFPDFGFGFTALVEGTGKVLSGVLGVVGAVGGLALLSRASMLNDDKNTIRIVEAIAASSAKETALNQMGVPLGGRGKKTPRGKKIPGGGKKIPGMGGLGKVAVGTGIVVVSIAADYALQAGADKMEKKGNKTGAAKARQTGSILNVAGLTAGGAVAGTAMGGLPGLIAGTVIGLGAGLALEFGNLQKSMSTLSGVEEALEREDSDLIKRAEALGASWSEIENEMGSAKFKLVDFNKALAASKVGLMSKMGGSNKQFSRTSDEQFKTAAAAFNDRMKVLSGLRNKNRNAVGRTSAEQEATQVRLDKQLVDATDDLINSFQGAIDALLQSPDIIQGGLEVESKKAMLGARVEAGSITGEEKDAKEEEILSGMRREAALKDEAYTKARGKLLDLQTELDRVANENKAETVAEYEQLVKRLGKGETEQVTNAKEALAKAKAAYENFGSVELARDNEKQLKEYAAAEQDVTAGGDERRSKIRKEMPKGLAMVGVKGAAENIVKALDLQADMIRAQKKFDAAESEQGALRIKKDTLKAALDAGAGASREKAGELLKAEELKGKGLEERIKGGGASEETKKKYEASKQTQVWLKEMADGATVDTMYAKLRNDQLQEYIKNQTEISQRELESADRFGDDITNKKRSVQMLGQSAIIASQTGDGIKENAELNRAQVDLDWEIYKSYEASVKIAKDKLAEQEKILKLAKEDQEKSEKIGQVGSDKKAAVEKAEVDVGLAARNVAAIGEKKGEARAKIPMAQQSMNAAMEKYNESAAAEGVRAAQDRADALMSEAEIFGNLKVASADAYKIITAAAKKAYAKQKDFIKLWEKNQNDITKKMVEDAGGENTEAGKRIKLERDSTVESIKQATMKKAETDYAKAGLEIAKKGTELRSQEADIQQGVIDDALSFASEFGSSFAAVNKLQQLSVGVARQRLDIANEELKNANDIADKAGIARADSLAVMKAQANVATATLALKRKELGVQKDIIEKMLGAAFGGRSASSGARRGVGSDQALMGVGATRMKSAAGVYTNVPGGAPGTIEERANQRGISNRGAGGAWGEASGETGMGGIFAATAAVLKTAPTRDPMEKLSNINERTALGVEELVKIETGRKGTGVTGTGGNKALPPSYAQRAAAVGAVSTMPSSSQRAAGVGAVDPGASSMKGEVVVTVKSDDNTFKSKVVRVLLSPEAKTNLGRAVFQ